MTPFLDLPLPRFVGLKSDSEVRYSSGPAGGDGLGVGCGTGSVSWTSTDRSTFRQLEASTKKARTRGEMSPVAFQPRPVCLFNAELESQKSNPRLALMSEA